MLKTLYPFSLLLTLILNSHAMAYEEAYPKSETGIIQILNLPPARLLEAEMDGTYFQNSNGLFSRLFDYIRTNEIAMTVPVEGNLGQAKMRFYVGSDVSSNIEDTDTVRVMNFEARTVLSVGSKGTYSEVNIGKAKTLLDEWLENQTSWTRSGEAYAVFWNGPFTPWFMKRFDVHIPVKSRNLETTVAN